ncbi:MAG: hypothetical protein WCT46_04750, partial [Candidatus Gracilibacteria bacterium]
MLKLIDTNRWLCGEKRVVFMTPPEAVPVPVKVETPTPTAEKTDAQLKQEAIDTKKAALAGKVESAKGVVANLRALYGENEQAVDTDTSKDTEVKTLCDGLSTKLDGMDAAFTAGVTKADFDYKTGLDTLEATLVAEVLAIKPEGAATELEAGIKEDVGTVVGKTVEQVATDLTQLETARDADKKAFEDAKSKISEYEEFIVDYVNLNPDKAQAFAALNPIINALKQNPVYLKNGINIDPVALTEATAALDKAFTEKVQALTGKSYDQLKAETIHVSEAQLKIGRDILGARRETPTSFNGGNIMGTEGLAARGITDAEHFNIKSFVEQPKGEPLAVEVMDYSEVSFRQVFADQAAFARMYKGIDLPEKGQTKTVPEVKWLPTSMPSPFGGLRRERSLTISVDKKSGAITVDVSKIQFGEPPNQSSEVKIPFKKPIDQLTVRDAICPNNDYKPGSGTDGAAFEAGSESGETAEAYLAKLQQYKEMASPENLKKLDAFKEVSDKWPVYLQDRLNSCRQLPDRIDDIKDAFKSNQSLPALAKEMEQLSKYDTLLKVLAKPTPTEDDFSQVPELKEYYDLMDKDKGLNYGEGANARGGYDIGQFESDFDEAGNILNNKFLDNLGTPHVSLVGVHMVFALGQNSQKSVSGTFTLHVNGYEGEDPITFSFSNVSGGTWEKAVAQAMTNLTEDKKKGGTLDTVEKQEKAKEHMEFVRGKVDEREKENLADRIRSIERHGTEDYNAFDDPDYKGDSRAKVEADIKNDFGNVYEYAYNEVKPGKWAAVRLCERGTTPLAADEKFGNAVNHSEKILVAHEQGEVDERELKNLAKRQEGKPESNPDYEGISNEAVVAAITAEHGDPAEYDIRLVDSGGYVAIRKCPRGTPGGEASGKFGEAAGLVREGNENLLSPELIDQLREDHNIIVTVENSGITKIDTSRVYLQTINGDGFVSSQVPELLLEGKVLSSVTRNSDGVAIFHLIDSNSGKEEIVIFSTEAQMPTDYSPSNLEEGVTTRSEEADNLGVGDDEIVSTDLGTDVAYQNVLRGQLKTNLG